MENENSLDFISDFLNAWKSLHDQPLMNMNPPAHLYHYTAYADSVIGIVKNGEFFLSPYDDLNDPTEMTHGLELSHICIRQACQKMGNLFKNEIMNSSSIPRYFALRAYDL